MVDQAFAGAPHLVCYSVKANGNLALLRSLAPLGVGLRRGVRGRAGAGAGGGGRAESTVFAGVGKTEPEMAFALRAGIGMFNVESAEELEALDRVGPPPAPPRPVRHPGQPRGGRRDAPAHLHRAAHLEVRRALRGGTRALRPCPPHARGPGPRRGLPHRQPAHSARSAGRGAPSGGGAVPRAPDRGTPAGVARRGRADSAFAIRTRSRPRRIAGRRPCARPPARPGPRCWSSRAGCWWATPACSSPGSCTASAPEGGRWWSWTQG